MARSHLFQGPSFRVSRYPCFPGCNVQTGLHKPIQGNCAIFFPGVILGALFWKWGLMNLWLTGLKYLPLTTRGACFTSWFEKKKKGHLHPREQSHIPSQGTFEDDVPFPKVGYISFVEGSWWLSLFLASTTWDSMRGPSIVCCFCHIWQISFQMGWNHQVVLYAWVSNEVKRRCLNFSF